MFNSELVALRSAIATYCQKFINLIADGSVGSEDLYRISLTGIENDSNAGVEPAQVVDYMGQVRFLIAGTRLMAKSLVMSTHGLHGSTHPMALSSMRATSLEWMLILIFKAL